MMWRTELGFLIAWALIGVMQIITCISGGPCTWVAYFCVLVCLLLDKFELMMIMKNGDLR